MRWLADSRVAVLITDRPAHAVALRATLRSGESLFQAGQERPHHLLSSPTRVTRSGRILRWFFPCGQRISGENKGEAVGWHGWPAHRWVDPHDTSLFHQSCWKKPKSVARVARMIEPALPRIQSIRPLPVEEPPGPWRLDSRQLPGRAVGGDLNTAWIDCWPTATNSRDFLYASACP